MPRLDPRRAAYLVAGILALWFSYDLMRKPIQVSDSFMELLDVQQSPSLYATFVAHSPRGPFLRPVKQVQTKVLFDLADGHYWLAFRGFHALLLTAMLFLFTRALRVRTWADFAAAVFALTVLTGLHTFRGTVREAFPINFYLESVVFCLIALNLAQGRVASRPDEPVLAGRSASADRHGGWWIDLAAAVTFVVASLNAESGLLVWVVVVAAWAGGMRGISRRGVVAMTLLLVAYLWVRFVYLSIGDPGMDVGRASGFGIRMLPPDEIVRRFGADPTWFYVYNVVTSILSVLFSDPDGGVFEIVRSWLRGDLPPRLYVAVVSSMMTTGLMVWVVAAGVRARARHMPGAGDQFFIIFAAVLIANAVMSYAYTKHEIISVAGAFYALAAFAASRHTIGYLGQAPGAARIALCLMLAMMATVWAFRSAGVHHMLQVQGFKDRNDWARLPPDGLADAGYPSDARARALATQLRRDALDMRVANPYLLPRWADRWWGE